jgi:tetratricopeptide (TPR) repeat protein
LTGRQGAAAVLLLLAGCGGRAAPDAPQDSALALAADSGRQSLEYRRLKQSAAQYQEAYTLALARNDVQAIGDSGYNLAVVQLADNDAAGALRTALRTRAALAVRAAPEFAELDLVQSAALHRLGRDAEADGLAARAQASAASPATRTRASYLRGVVADARGDAAGLAAALAAFGQPKAPLPDWEADREDLTARLALLRGQYREAAAHAQRAADIHRTQLDYRAMAEAVVIAARAMQRAGSPQDAANFYLQAGESAAARGDAASAARWLKQAMRPGADAGTRRSAQNTLDTLPKTASR